MKTGTILSPRSQVPTWERNCPGKLRLPVGPGQPLKTRGLPPPQRPPTPQFRHSHQRGVVYASRHNPVRRWRNRTRTGFTRIDTAGIPSREFVLLHATSCCNPPFSRTYAKAVISRKSRGTRNQRKAWRSPRVRHYAKHSRQCILPSAD